MKSELLGTANVFSRLDQAYACWEEDMWRTKIQRQVFQLSNPNYKPELFETGFPVDGSHKTKQLLLESVSKGSLDYLLPMSHSKEIEQRLSSGEEVRKMDYGEGKVAGLWNQLHFPYYLGKWSASSRRIYYIPNDLMLLLEATSLRGLTFRDVHLPFPSFAIALETPLVIEGEGKELDFFLIGDFSTTCFAFYGLARSLAKIRTIDPSLRTKIDMALQKGNLRRSIQLAEKKLKQFFVIENHWDTTVIHGESLLSPALDEDLEEMLSKGEIIPKGWMTKFFRLFLGLSFYLNTLGNSYSDVTEQIPSLKKAYAGAKDGPALMDSAEVCKVQSIVKLSPEETTIIRDQLSGRGGWEVRAHFREGFWRRPRGEGHNPLAKKTIWVRPTLVRRDRLPENALPFGVGKVVLA